MRIWAFDPGTTIGWAEWNTGWWGEYASSQCDWEEFCEVLPKIGQAHRDIVIYETFTPRPGVRTWQPDPLYVIGALKFWMQNMGLPIIGIAPSSSKGLVSDKMLRYMDLWKPGQPHANDATRLLVAAAITDQVDIPLFKEGARAYDLSHT